MPDYLRVLAQLTVTMIVVACSSSVQASEKPNILFIFADDQCYETIGAAGLTDIDTPNLDRLTERGTTFTHAYNMGSWSGAVCVASRCMLVTGRSVWDAKSVYNTTNQEREQGRFWPGYMKQAGYRTYFTGKWHVRTDATKAFDVASHIRGGMPKQTEAGYNRPLADTSDPWDPADPKFGGFWEGGTHWTQVVADDAVGFLDDASQQRTPFFMYIAFNAPHDPRQAPQEYLDLYPLSRIELPGNFLSKYPYCNDIGCSPKLRDEALAPFPRTRHAVKVHRREYYAAITYMDYHIGRILDRLEESGQAEDTYIFFTADHGLGVGRHGLLGKQNMYDHSLRVPFIVAGPEVPSGKSRDAPIYLQDVMPTTLELAGVEQPDHVYFQSLLPLIEGTTAESRYESIYGAYLDLQRAIIHDGFKLIVYPKAKIVRLYDLNEDAGERNDLAENPEYQERVQSLFRELLEQQRELKDTLDLEQIFPQIATRN